MREQAQRTSQAWCSALLLHLQQSCCDGMEERRTAGSTVFEAAESFDGVSLSPSRLHFILTFVSGPAKGIAQICPHVSDRIDGGESESSALP